METPGALCFAAAVALAGAAMACDAFDFGRVTGSAASASPSALGRPEGSAAPREPEVADPLVLVLGGRVALSSQAGARLEAGAKVDPLSGIRAALSGAHLRVASLEGSLGGKTAAEAATRAQALSRAGIDVLVSRAADATASLEQAGIRVAAPAASGLAEPLLLPVQGWTVALIASAPGAGEAAPDPVIAGARKSGALVLVLHDGSLDDEALEVPFPRRALAAGADAVLGLGARMTLGVSWSGNRPAVHGLGGLVAEADPKEPWSARGVFARLRFFRDGRRELDLCPYRLTEGFPALLAGPGRPTEEGIFSRTLLRRSEEHGGIAVSEPDLHSCLRVNPVAKAATDGGSAPVPAE